MEEIKDYFYKCPTAIYLTSNGISKAGEIILKEGFKKVFVLYGGHSLEKSGNLAKLEESLKENHIEYQLQGGILPNPDISFIYKYLPVIKKYQPELILAVGGGSVIDTAKNICVSYFYDGDPLDFNKKIVTPKKSLPLGTILTLAAAGSEMSDSCVISDYKTNFKSGFKSVFNRPTFSILSPELTLTVSMYQTCCGLVDIISHSFERYFSPSTPHDVCDYFALGVIRNMVEVTPLLIKNPNDVILRRAMMLNSTVAHNGWTSFGKEELYFPCHMAEHEMSGTHPELTHGLGLRFLLCEFLKINKERLSDKIVKFGRFVFDINSNDPEDTIKAFDNFLDSLPLVHRMTEVGFTKEEETKYLSQLKIKY